MKYALSHMPACPAAARGLAMLLSAAALVLLCSGVSLASPASPDAISITQPDGSRFTAYVRGDEFQGWVETGEGYTVVKDGRTNAWFYAERADDGTLRPSAMRVRPGKGPPPELLKRLKPPRDNKREKDFADRLIRRGPPAGRGRPGSGPQSTAPSGVEGASAPVRGLTASDPSGYWYPYPVSGSRNLLVVLVNFSDRSFVTDPSDWYGSVFDNSSGVKSVANFYTDNSFGALSISPVSHTQPGGYQGIVSVDVPLTHPDCSNNITYSVESGWLNAALDEASAYVNFSSLDTSGDGAFQDSELVVYFVLAGYEASGTTKTPNIWAHSWSGSGVYAGGVALERWALNGELNYDDAQHTMGVIAHELGHSMCGLPDLYDTTYTNKGMGGYSLMSAGSWGRALSDTYSGATPVSLDAWSRRHVGWSSPRDAGIGCDADFPPALSAQDAPLMLNNTTVSTTQFFLVENRYPSGWDLGLERWLGSGWGGGLLVQHIDITVGTSTNDGTTGLNDINKYVSGGHQGVLIEEASTEFGTLAGNTSYAHVTHLFYDDNNTDFADDTSPGTRLYDGTPTGLGLYGISARAETMTAHFAMPVSGIDSPPDGAYLFTNSTTVKGTATDGCGSGLQLVEVSWDGGQNWYAATDTSGDGSWSSWEYVWTLPSDGFYDIVSRTTDTGGRVQSLLTPVSVAVGPEDSTPPSGSVTVAGGDSTVPTADVVLGISASDDGLGMQAMRISDDGAFNTEPWEPYINYRTWVLSNSSGLNTVEVVFRDWAGNDSAPVSDGVTVDPAGSAPDVIWSRVDGSTADDYAESVAFDGSDAVYAAGSTFGNLDWNKKAGYRDIALMRFNARGNRLWSRQIGTDDYDRAYAVAADSSGNAYVAGYSAGPLDGNTYASWQDMVLLKYSEAGELVWSVEMGTNDVDIAYAADVGPSGDIYVTGISDGDFDGHIGAGDYDYILVKFDSGGNKLWSVLDGTAKYDSGRAVTVDASGNAYVSGYMTDLGYDFHSPAPSDIFIAKYDSSGNFAWRKTFDSLLSERGYGIDVDSSGNLYLCGYTEGVLGMTGSSGGDDMVLMKLDASGDEVWTWQLGSGTDERATHVSVDSTGNVYVAGYTYGDMGSTNAGMSDLFAMKFDANGTRVWTWQDGFSQDDILTGAHADGDGVYLAGYTKLSVADGGDNTYEFWTVRLGLLAEHCKNLTQDADEDDVDCGGTDCISCDTEQPDSEILYPSDGTYVGGPDITVTGTALDTGGSGLNHIEVSTDDGLSWQTASGTDPWGYSWTSVTDGTYRLYTRGVDNAGNTGFARGPVEVTVGPPDSDPPTGSVVINGGEDYTIYDTVTLTLAATDDISGLTDMRISSDGVFDTEPWENYTSVRELTLSDVRGMKTVYAQFRDFAGNVSNPVSDDIFYSNSSYAYSSLWTRLIGTSLDEAAYDVAVDSTGNAYVVGSTAGVLDGGSSYGGKDMFIAKYSSDGTELWVRQLGGSGDDKATDVTLAGDGSVYVCGEAVVGFDGLASNGVIDVFIVKYDSDGNKLWRDLIGSSFNDRSGGVAVDGSGNVYLAGSAFQDLNGVTDVGSGDYFVVKFSSDGTMGWTALDGTAGEDIANGIVADRDGNTYITGYVSDSIDGGQYQGQGDFMIIKFSPDGNELWNDQIGSVLGDTGYDMVIGTDDDIYISGMTLASFDGHAQVWGYDIIILKYSPEGQKEWSVLAGSNNNERGYAIAPSPGGGVFVAGGTNGQLGGNSNAGSDDVYVMKYDPTGRRLWTRQIGTSSSDIAYGAASDSFGNVYLAGVTSGGLGGETALGGTDGFLMKLGIEESVPELTHYNYSPVVTGGDCSACHSQQGAFTSGMDIAGDRSFCASCHNAAGAAHEASSGRPGMHYGFASVTSIGYRYPTYGNITSGEYDNRPFARLGAGDTVVCATCHNVMRKTEDIGRVWELTATSDYLTYYLQNGPWSDYGYVEPVVYRDTTLWTGPFYSSERKAYRVDASGYTYDESAGTVTFGAAQDPSVYIYVTLSYPSLRANNSANKLCSDCHTEQTHMSDNCLTCHDPHGSGNLSGVRETVRTTDRTGRSVRFVNRTGIESFADGDTTFDGICEVCHTATKYYTRDGSGFTNHSSGEDFSGADCIACHTHGTGFSK